LAPKATLGSAPCACVLVCSLYINRLRTFLSTATRVTTSRVCYWMSLFWRLRLSLTRMNVSPFTATHVVLLWWCYCRVVCCVVLVVCLCVWPVSLLTQLRACNLILGLTPIIFVDEIDVCLIRNVPSFLFFFLFWRLRLSLTRVNASHFTATRVTTSRVSSLWMRSMYV